MKFKIILTIKSIFIIIVMLFLFSCSKENTTEVQTTLQEKYTIPELEQDSDWVEITNADTLEILNLTDSIRKIWFQNYSYSERIKSNAELESVYEDIKDYASSSLKSVEKDIDFKSEDLILTYIDAHRTITERKIFKNEKEKKYIYIIEIFNKAHHMDNNPFFESITIPKIPDNSTFLMDTLYVDLNKR